jgi:outer membrane protein assembly factor BamB
MRRRTWISFTVLFLSATTLRADDFEAQKLNNWHQWRGPLATGVAPKGSPPAEWSADKNIKWKVPIPGRGSASPIVWGDRIFILTAVETDRTAPAAEQASSRRAGRIRVAAFEQNNARQAPADFALAQANPSGTDSDRDRSGNRRPDGDRRGGDRRGDGRRGGGRRGGFGGRFNIAAPTKFYQFNVLCIDRHTGKTLWQRTACEVVPHEGHHDTGSFASASPFTDGKFLYASFGSRGIYCYDLDGNPQWDTDLGDFRMRFSFGEGSSPAVLGDTLVQICDQEQDSFIAALDARTGKEKWRKPRDEVSTWGTPLIIEAAGRTQVITSGANRVRSYDLRDGELIWECGGLGSNPIACPIAVDGLAIAMTGHDDPAGIAVHLDAKGDVTDTDKVAWKIEDSTSYVASPLMYDGTIYFPKSRNAILSSVNAKTGEYIISQERLPDIRSIYASPVAAADRIYISSREGVTLVIKPAEQLEIIATNNLDETIDASPAIVGNDLIIRTENNLYCIGE